MKKCVIYARVASDKVDDKLNSLEGQVNTLKEYASKNNFEVYEVFEEYGSCSSNRPAFSYMLEKIRQGKIKTILCTDINRIIRSYCDSQEIYELFENSGVVVISIYSKDNSEPHNYLAKRIQDAMRESDHYHRSQVIKRGLQAKKLREEAFAKSI